jgi:hypothetical protein
MADQTLILAVPGTQETRELNFETVRAAVARGEIALDNWAWSPAQNAWLPLAQLPEYAAVAAPATPSPAPVIAPARVIPVVNVKTPVVPQVVVEPEASVPVPVVAKAVRVATPAQVSVAHNMNAGRGQMAATFYSKPIQEDNEFPIFKILFVVLGVIIAALVTVNYFMVDQPFRTALAKTPFSTVQVHAHLGAFVQPTALLIHIIPNGQITEDNFADFLTAVAQSAPRSAVAGETFSTMGLTSAWLGQYVITSEDWSGFADMTGYTPEEKKQFVLTHLENSDGTSVFIPAKNDTADARKAREDRAWTQLVNHFRGQNT